MNGNVIILGGWSKYYNGYNFNYDKHWVGLKILTPQASIDWHQKAYEELGHPWLLDKITKLKTLYGI